jgi:hypothetical protein
LTLQLLMNISWLKLLLRSFEVSIRSFAIALLVSMHLTGAGLLESLVPVFELPKQMSLDLVLFTLPVF